MLPNTAFCTNLFFDRAVGVIVSCSRGGPRVPPFWVEFCIIDDDDDDDDVVVVVVDEFFDNVMLFARRSVSAVLFNNASESKTRASGLRESIRTKRFN